MWIFSTKAFLSVVQDKDDSRYLVVRSRVKGDIEVIFPGASVDNTASGDYRYRSWLKRKVVIDALAKTITKIDYVSYKNAVEDHRRSFWYSQIWGIGAEMQNTIEEDQPAC